METFSEIGDDSSFIVLASQESEAINPGLFNQLQALNNNEMVKIGNGDESPDDDIEENPRFLSSDTSSMSEQPSSESDLDVTVKKRARMNQQPRKLQMLSTQEMAQKDLEDDDEEIVLTPAGHLQSLQFSGQTSRHVMESADDSDIVPPSQDYGIPMMIPSSPTAAEGPQVSCQSPRSRRNLQFPSLSPRRFKNKLGGLRGRQQGNGNQSSKGDGNPKQDEADGSTSNTTTQQQQWAPSASLSISSGRQGGSSSSDSNEGDRTVIPRVLPADKEKEEKDEEKEEEKDEEKEEKEAEEEDKGDEGEKEEEKEEKREQLGEQEEMETQEETSAPEASMPLICPVHGIKEETDNEASQQLVLQLSQSQGILPQEGSGESQKSHEPQPSTSGKLDSASQKSELDESIPPSASIRSHSADHRERESESPHFTFARPTLDIPQESEKDSNLSVFKKAARLRREAEAKKLAPDSSSGDDPYAFESQNFELGKRKRDGGDEDRGSKRFHSEKSPEQPSESVRVDLGPQTLVGEDPSLTQEYMYTGLRHTEADSVSHPKTPAQVSTEQEAVTIVESGSSEETPKEGVSSHGEVEPRPYSHSAPEASSTRRVYPRRPSNFRSAGRGSSEKTARHVRKLGEKALRRKQMLSVASTSQTVQSPQMTRFLASHDHHHQAGQPHPQGAEANITVTTQLFRQILRVRTVRKYDPTSSSGENILLSEHTEVLETTPLSGDDVISPSSSRSSRPSIASGELGDVSSLSRSSGDPSSGSIVHSSMPAPEKKSPSASSSYNPDRHSIGDYMKRASIASSIHPVGDGSPLHRQRTISGEDAPVVVASSTANASTIAVESAAQSEALFSSPGSKMDTSANRTTSTSNSSIPCAQPPSKQPRKSDGSTVASSSGMSLALSPTIFPTFDSSRSRSSSGGKTSELFSTTTSSHNSTDRRSEDGLFRVPTLPLDKSKQKAATASKQAEQETASDDTMVEEKDPEEQLTPQAATPKTTEVVEPPLETPEQKRRKQSTKKSAPASKSEQPVAAQRGAAAKASVEDKGVPVYAQWKDKFFYPGHLVGEEKGGKYKIRFEDGNSLQVRDTDIIMVDLLPLGQEMMAEKEDNCVPATVLDHEDGDYLVKYDDDAEARLERVQVIMNPEQAKDFAKLAQAKPGTPQLDAANVSLDNLVDGKRKRGAVGTPVKRSAKDAAKDSATTRASTPTRSVRSSSRSSSSSTKSSSTTKSTSTKKGSTAKKGKGRGRGRGKSPARKVGVKDEEEAGPSEVKQEKEEIPTSSDLSGIDEDQTKRRTKRRLIEPKATSTPTPQKKRARINPQLEELAEPLSPLHKPSTPAGVKGPIPSRGSQLFRNMKFLLTHVESAQRLAKGRLSSPTTDESIHEEDREVAVDFDKDYLTRQIEAGGGTVLDSFDVDEVTDDCYCVSDNYQRTLKYLHCLAAKVVAVSHVWIHNCCSANKILDHNSYLLPAGHSLERKTEMEQNFRSRPFSGRTVVISSKNEKFENTWTDVMTSAGCRVLHTAPTKKTEAKEIMVAIADKNTSSAIVKKLKNLGITLVSSEWVIQCLVTGTAPPTDGHPKYLVETRASTPEESL